MTNHVESMGAGSGLAADSHINPSERARMLEQILYLQRLEDGAHDETRYERLQGLMRAYESAFGPQKWE